MNRMLFGYGSARGTAIRYKKWVGAVATLALLAILWCTYVKEGRPGKVHVDNLNHDGPDPFAFLMSIGEEELEELAVGEEEIDPLNASRMLENLGDLEVEAMVREESNTSIVTNELIFDKDGHEIGLRFLVLSDWGGTSVPPYTTHTQMNVGRAMADIANNYDCSFFLSLGDNFCDAGVKDVNDRRFEDTFEDVFTQPSLKRPWYVVAGDKDYKGNVSAQIEYTKKSRRWSFEANYYKRSAHLPTFRNITVDFIMIDTVQLCGALSPLGSRQPAGPSDVIAAEKQWKWIDNKLRFSGAEYVIVSGHYPVYSGGRMGSTRCLIDRLQPMLERYRVSAYIGGHDHSLQHIKSPGDGGVHYFVSGAASPQDDHPEHLDGVMTKTRYFWTNHLDPNEGGFLYCDVRKKEMLVSFVKSDKVVLYVASLLPRNHPANLKPVYDPQDTGERANKALAIPVLKKHPNLTPRKQGGMKALTRPHAPVKKRVLQQLKKTKYAHPSLTRQQSLKQRQRNEMIARKNAQARVNARQHAKFGNRFRGP